MKGIEEMEEIKGLKDYTKTELELMTREFLKENDHDKTYFDDEYMNKKINKELNIDDESLQNGFIASKKYYSDDSLGYLTLIKYIKRDDKLNKRKKSLMKYQAKLDAETPFMDRIELHKQTNVKALREPYIQSKKQFIKLLQSYYEIKSNNQNLAYHLMLDIMGGLKDIKMTELELLIIESLMLGFNVNEISKLLGCHPMKTDRTITKIYKKIVNKM